MSNEGDDRAGPFSYPVLSQEAQRRAEIKLSLDQISALATSEDVRGFAYVVFGKTNRLGWISSGDAEAALRLVGMLEHLKIKVVDSMEDTSDDD